MKKLIGRLIHKEWDGYTKSWIRLGWIAERQELMDEEYERWQRGERQGGTCLDCGQPTDDHPMPDRLWRSGPDLCTQVRQFDGDVSAT
jgi:hypothetical protein